MRLAVALLVASSCAPTDPEPAELPAEELVRPGGKADDAFARGPMFLTGAFDGSQRFAMWIDTMAFARQIQRDHGKSLAFTYFINTAYYDHTVERSWIGTAKDAREEVVRWALTQQAVNEGHEIGNHTVRHQDGSAWTQEQWREEIDEFHALAEARLFQSVRDAGGAPVFPRWKARGAARAAGAACSAATDCDSGRCLAVTPTQGFCTQACNKHKPCPGDTVCGTPDYSSDTDVCVPMPEYPIVHQGQELFSADGRPNLSHPALEPYPIVGFRAPQLGKNLALYEVLAERRYRYDTSFVLAPGPPTRTVQNGQLFPSMYQFPLMKNPGSLTIPMDYNYNVADGSGSRMTTDYKKSIVDAYRRGRQPWNIGHHFALWKGGAYFTAMKDAFDYAARGCPDGAGVKQCAEIAFPSFAELADRLDGSRADGDTWIDGDLESWVLDEQGGCGEESH